ncbi:MAG: aspartyl protease family protein [Phycisphaerales bacterium]|nr:aspartyl protease family protein [Phycisphaerales bacterium]
MPHLNGALKKSGPLVDVLVSVSEPRLDALLAAGRQIPPAIKIRALIDTGASCTAIDTSIVRKLEIPATGTVDVRTPSTGATPHTFNQYDIQLTILDERGNPLSSGHSIPIVGSDFSGQDIEALIGRDLLAMGILIYNGTAGSFTLSY